MEMLVRMGTGRWEQRGEISGVPPVPQKPIPASGRPLCYLRKLVPLSLGQQVKLKQVIPVTEEEKTEHGVAAERRRMRLVYADTIKDLLAHCAIQDGECRNTHKRAAGYSQEGCWCLQTPFEWKEEGIPYGPVPLMA